MNPIAAESSSESERRFRSFADAIPTLAWMARADGWITWYNQRWYEYTGTTPEQMEGWGWQTVHNPGVLPFVMERWSGSIQTGKPFQMIFPLRGGDGVYRSFLTRVSPVRDDAGTVIQWIGTNTEVDELQRTREALQASEQELRYTVDLNPQISWTATPDGQLTEYPLRWREMTGLTLEEALGGGWVQVQHPEDRPLMEAAWTMSLATGTPFDLEHRIRGASGVYSWHRSRASPRLDEDGRVVKWYGTTENIDERKQEQEALRRSEERFRLALATVPTMGTFDWNVQLDHLFVDAQLSRLWWMDPAVGAAGVPVVTFLNLLHPDDRQRVEDAIGRTLRTGEEYAADYRIVHTDETMRWISARASCLFNAEGVAVRFLGVCLDFTERRLTEQALIQNEKLAAVGRLAASIAHEINNPLESVSNLLFLARQATDSPELVELLTTAQQEVRRVAAISNQSLRFHRQSTKPTQLSCDELMLSAVSLYQGRIQSAGVTIEKRKRATKPVTCFEGEIRQVLSNLIGNAIDAMAPGPGRLLLRSRQGTRWSTGAQGLTLTIADTGGGMSPKTAKRVFEPFFTTKESAGTGLGLWISQEILSRHNGSLRFRTSQRKGHSGTVFTLFLPFEAALRT